MLPSVWHSFHLSRKIIKLSPFVRWNCLTFSVTNTATVTRIIIIIITAIATETPIAMFRDRELVLINEGSSCVPACNYIRVYSDYNYCIVAN